LADPGRDLPFAELLFELFACVAAVGPQLARLDPAFAKRLQQRQQVPPFVLVAGRQPDLERQPGAVDN